MHKGIIVERGSTEDIFFRPKEDYTQRLIAAIPTPYPPSVLTLKGLLTHD